MSQASHIERIALVVRDVEAAARFYEEALGFETVSAADEAARRVRRLRLGDQDLELMAFTPPGRAYPAGGANAPWFQHFAIAVSDMAAAYETLCRHPHTPISVGGPQRLPPSTGSVTAYKFRDPDGHPLELSHIPRSDWTRRAGGPFLGIDHSAVAVADPAASIAFYEGLGFEVSGRGRNRGPEQDRLDGLPGADLDIISLKTARPGPHLELLYYRTPAPEAPIALAPHDIAATRLVLATQAARGLIQDPDGHFIDAAA